VRPRRTQIAAYSAGLRKRLTVHCWSRQAVAANPTIQPVAWPLPLPAASAYRCDLKQGRAGGADGASENSRQVVMPGTLPWPGQVCHPDNAAATPGPQSRKTRGIKRVNERQALSCCLERYVPDTPPRPVRQNSNAIALGHRHASTGRRLITASPKSRHSSKPVATPWAGAPRPQAELCTKVHADHIYAQHAAESGRGRCAVGL